MRQQAVTGAHVDDAAAAKQPPHPPRNFPRFVEFFSRQTSGLANGAAKTVEQPIG